MDAFANMLSCRMCCSDDPFNALFGGPQASSSRPRRADPARRRESPARSEANIEVRNEAEVKELVAQWKPYVHRRSKEFFTTDEDLEAVLTLLAQGLSRSDDAVFATKGSTVNCVQWCGEVTKDDLQPVILMKRPGQAAEELTYVNRIIAFMFADDDAFDELMSLPKEPFKMTCENQLCVHLSHVGKATVASSVAR
eukprot:TRINITY_DN38804_c0_g1_i1.p1 TRINITY_DN38804_c0_g1~~TRINITY_DN38804_c0_g1_i1.p1  ORF type:complete len:196 (-),score=54.64 TRINITY_DN38804_c0_g1_i1:126-713(-)